MPMPVDTSSKCCSTHPSGLAIQVGLPRLSARPTVEDVSGRRQEGVIPDTTSIGGLDEPLDY